MMMQRILMIHNPITIIFPSLLKKCAPIHLNALESLKPTEKKIKTRKMFIFPLLFTGRISVELFLYFYSICNNLIYFCFLYVSFQTIKLFIYNIFRHFSVVRERNLNYNIALKGNSNSLYELCPGT
jgi:hypothetical protein